MWSCTVFVRTVAGSDHIELIKFNRSRLQGNLLSRGSSLNFPRLGLFLCSLGEAAVAGHCLIKSGEHRIAL